jgi:hypothetical protein
VGAFSLTLYFGIHLIEGEALTPATFIPTPHERPDTRPLDHSEWPLCSRRGVAPARLLRPLPLEQRG